MKSADRKLLFYGLGSIAVGTAMRAVARHVWSSTRGTPAPEDPSDPHVDTKDAMIWTVGVALLSGFTKLAYRSLFADSFHQLAEDSDLVDTD